MGRPWHTRWPGYDTYRLCPRACKSGDTASQTGDSDVAALDGRTRRSLSTSQGARPGWSHAGTGLRCESVLLGLGGLHARENQTCTNNPASGAGDSDDDALDGRTSRSRSGARAGGHGLLLLDLDHGCTQDARWDVPREGGRKMGVRGLAQTHAADMNDPSHDVPKYAAKCPHIMIGTPMKLHAPTEGHRATTLHT